MKLKIQGEVTLPVLGEAFTKALQASGYIPEQHSIRGATVYFNLYDRQSGDMLAVMEGNEVLDSLLWTTPEEREKKRQQAEHKKAKRKKLD